MTSFRISDNNTSDVCPQCQGPVSERPLRGYPVLAQTLFGLSFIGFIIFFDHVSIKPQYLWLWSGIQVLLGIWLIRGRRMARMRVYRCVRCSTLVR